MWESKPTKLEQSSVSAEPQLAEQEKPIGITVYVSGAVVSPGMYKIPAGSRAVEAIGMIAAILKMHPYAVQLMIATCQHFPLQALKHCLVQLAQINMLFKM